VGELISELSHRRGWFALWSLGRELRTGPYQARHLRPFSRPR